jgi:hypothetical protein
MKPESLIPRCSHSVYVSENRGGNHSEGRDYSNYSCTLCCPAIVNGEVLKRIKTAVGPLTLIIETEASVEFKLAKAETQAEWDARLDAELVPDSEGELRPGYRMDTGATPHDHMGIDTYLRSTASDTNDIIAETDVKKGFRIVLPSEMEVDD